MTFQDVETFVKSADLFSTKYTRKTALFRKKLNDLRNSASPKCVLMQITPEMAEIMLEYNREGNRPISENHVGNLANEMGADEWLATTQGIGFDTNGALTDGQHRLRSCIEAKKVITSWVMFGIEPTAFTKIDRGRLRTVGQICAMAGIADANNMSAAARIALLYERDDISMGSSFLNIKPTAASRDARPNEILEFIEEHPTLLKVGKGSKELREFHGLTYSALLALTFILTQKHPQKGGEFIDKLCTGLNLNGKEDPIYRLRKRLQQIKDKRERTPAAWKLAYCVKIFNAWSSGAILDVIKVVPGEKFPRVK